MFQTKETDYREQILDSRPIGIIAGAGSLPAEVVESCIRQNKKVFVLRLEEENKNDDILEKVPNQIVNIASVGKSIKLLNQHQVKEILFIGHISRPKWSALRPDATGLKLLAKVVGAKTKGDDSLLTIVMKFFEEYDFKILGIKDVAPNILASKGNLTTILPDKDDFDDIDIGVKALNVMGVLDIGQSIIVQNKVIIGIEAMEGTDNLIKRCKDLIHQDYKGILVKLKKTGQDNRIDLPTIGPITIENAYNSRLKGIVIQSENTIIANKELVIKKANEYKIFVIGI